MHKNVANFEVTRQVTCWVVRQGNQPLPVEMPRRQSMHSCQSAPRQRAWESSTWHGWRPVQRPSPSQRKGFASCHSESPARRASPPASGFPAPTMSDARLVQYGNPALGRNQPRYGFDPFALWAPCWFASGPVRARPKISTAVVHR